MPSAHDAGEADRNLQLVTHIISGDRDAETAFVNHFRPRVGALLLARSRDPELTADLQQEVMIEALCALRNGQLRDASKLSSFVIAIARNLLNNHFRGLRRMPERGELRESHLRCEADDALEEQQRREVAARAIEALEPVDRSILQMTLVEGLKSGAVAERLHMNPVLVRQRKLRATRRVIELVRHLSQKPALDHHSLRTSQ